MLIIWICLLLTSAGFAQQLPLSSQYVINPYFLSPAMTGHSTNYEAFLGYQQSWLGIDGAPEVRTFNVNGPIGDQMGLGASIMDDQVGIFRSLHMNLSYAYHLQVGDESKLSFGAQLGLIDQQIRVPRGGLVDPAAILAQGNQEKHINLGVGLNYQWRALDVGVVVPYLLEQTTTAGDTSGAAYVQARHYRAYLRYRYDLTSDWSITPMVAFNTTLQGFNADVNALVNYKDFAWLGVGYNSGNTFQFHLGGLPTSFLSLQYSFGIGGSGILASSSGNHELILGLLIGANESGRTSIFGRKASERQKSYYKWLNF